MPGTLLFILPFDVCLCRGEWRRGREGCSFSGDSLEHKMHGITKLNLY